MYTILQSGYSYEPLNADIISVEPQSGQAYAQRRTLSEPYIFNVTFQTDDRDGFESWAQSVAVSGYTESLQVEAGAPVDVDVVFTDSGYPQLQSVEDGTYTYSAQLFANELPAFDDGLYGMLLFGAQNSQDSDPETFFEILDIGINQVLPEA